MHKLLYITNQICGSGGLERVLSIKTSYLIEKFDYEVHIITLNQGNEPLFYEFSSKLIYHDIQTKGNKIKSFYAYKKMLLEKVKEIKPGVISVCDDGLKGFFVPKFIKKPCPMIYERHASKNLFNKNSNNSLFQKLKFTLINKLLHIGGRSYDKFIVLTNDNLNEWNLSNLKVIPNPLSFYPKTISKLSNKKIITVANHGYQKGIDRLIKIAALITKKHPDWVFEVYGKKVDIEKHNNLVKDLGITKNITFKDPIKNIKDKYLEATIYAMPSRSEGFGMVLIEAMICGIPCVSFNCPCGPKDILNDNIDGFLVKDNDLIGFANKISFLIQNEDQRKLMGEQARINAEAYLPKNVIPLWDELFRSLITEKL